MSDECSASSPPLRLDVVHVRMLADLDVGDGLTDVEAVLDDGVALPDRLRGDLMADGNVVHRLHLDGGVVLHHPADQLLPGLDALDDGDTDGVLLVMHEKMDHVIPSIGVRSRGAASPRALMRMGPAPALTPSYRVGRGLSNLIVAPRYPMNGAPAARFHRCLFRPA